MVTIQPMLLGPEASEGMDPNTVQLSPSRLQREVLE